MYTDKAYLVTDEFREEGKQPGSLATLYRPESEGERESLFDKDLIPFSYGIKTVPGCPPGLEKLFELKKIFLTKRLVMLENDIFGIYKGEIIDEQGDRIFVISSAPHYDSDEVIHWGKQKAIKVKGKICFGVINYAGIQVFEVYGDPEKALRIGPSSTVWGEIQVIPGDAWDEMTQVCFRLNNKPMSDAQVRVVVLKRNFLENTYGHELPHKQVYLLRGQIVGGCCHQERNMLYRKSFDMKIYPIDPFDVSDSPKKKSGAGGSFSLKEPDPIGRLCSEEFHNVLECHLPMLEIPQAMSIFDKLTLMGGFFMFNLKI